MEYTKKTSASGTSKAALGLGIAGTALGLGVFGGNGGGLLSGFGARPFAHPVGGGAITIDNSGAVVAHGGYVTEKEMGLIRENGAKDAVIAQLQAERYTNDYVQATVKPLENRICALETAQAVNAARDQDFRRYVNSEFVHQPKASIKDSIVVCRNCGCECDCA